jgi:hypothetical protein
MIAAGQQQEPLEMQVDDCIPNCESCPGRWTNNSHLVRSVIICLCCKTNHQNKTSSGLRPTTSDTDTDAPITTLRTNQNDQEYSGQTTR